MFKDTSSSGEGGDYNKDSNRKYRDNDRRSNDHEGAPDGNDPDDNDDNNHNGDDDISSGDRHSLTGNSNTQTSSTDPRPGSKSTKLHHKSLQWNGMRANLRVYITNWQEHLKDIEDTSAIMFLSRCVPSEYRELVLSHTKLEVCLTYLGTYCANEDNYCDKKLEIMKSAKNNGGC